MPFCEPPRQSRKIICPDNFTNVNKRHHASVHSYHGCLLKPIGHQNRVDRFGESDNGRLVLTIVSLGFECSGLIIGVTAIALKFDPVPWKRPGLALMGLVGAAVLSGGSVMLALNASMGTPVMFGWSYAMCLAASIALIAAGLALLGALWHRATKQ